MAFSDWVVEVTKETDMIENSVNKETGQRIFPDGFVAGKRVEMALTHSGGAVLVRVDNFVPYSVARLQQYARDVVSHYETLKAGAAVVAVGVLDILPLRIEPTADQKDATVFQQADAIIKRLSVLAPEETDAITRAQVLLDAKQQPVKDAEVARLKDQLTQLEAQAANVAITP